LTDIPAPDAPAGWYRDPDQPETQRYWDGEQWTDQRAPLADRSSSSWVKSDGGLTEGGRFALGLILAGVGAIVAIVGVFLPYADTESNLHIADNSLIQHWEGIVIIILAVAAFIAAAVQVTRPLTFLAGAALVVIAVIAGTDLPIEYRNRFSEQVAGDASPGAGIWTVGVGGALLMIAALFTDWRTLFARASAGDGANQESAEQTPPEDWEQLSRFQQIMRGKSPPAEYAASETADEEREPDREDVERG
jgi:hypothetical protein